MGTCGESRAQKSWKACLGRVLKPEGAAKAEVGVDCKKCTI